MATETLEELVNKALRMSAENTIQIARLEAIQEKQSAILDKQIAEGQRQSADIQALMTITKEQGEWARQSITNLEKQWQAYLNTIAPKQ